MRKPTCGELPEILRKTFELMAKKANKDDLAVVRENFKTLCLNFKDCEYKFYVVISEEGMVVPDEKPAGRPDCIILTNVETIHDLALGKISETKAYLAGNLKISGVSAIQMKTLLPKLGPLNECYTTVIDAVMKDVSMSKDV